MADEDAGAMSALEQKKRDLEVVQALYAHWARGDFDFAEVFAEDVVYVPEGIEEGEYKGIGQISKVWRKWLQAWDPPFRIRATEVIPGPGGRYVVMQEFRGTGKSSGVESEASTAAVFTLQDGKITRMEGHWERAEALRAAGIT
jgi:ketosteroid isomerase-like protein